MHQVDPVTEVAEVRRIPVRDDDLDTPTEQRGGHGATRDPRPDDERACDLHHPVPVTIVSITRGRDSP